MLKQIGLKIILFFLLSPILGFSQSDHYWSQNFNVRSSLLSGAVVGGKAGVSAVYYNPALIGHDSTMKLSLSVSLISLQFYDIKNFAGDDIDMYQFNFKLQPKYVSYILQPSNDRIFIEAAFLSRVSDDLTFNVDHNVNLDIIKRLDGNENYTGNLNSSRKYDDYWVGAGMSYSLGNNWSLGASLFVSIKLMDYSYGHSMYAFQPNDTLYSGGIPEPYYFPQFFYEEKLKYWDLSLISKIGMHYRSEDQTFGFGINLTFPNLGIYGEGDVGKKVTRSNIHNDEAMSFTDELVMLEKQRKVRTTIKDPFSVAVGFDYTTPNKRNTGLLTIEYFTKTDPYQLIKTSGELSNTNDAAKALFGNRDVMSFHYTAGPVTNIALGFVQYFNEKISALGGFRTDFSSATELPDNTNGEKPQTFKIHQDKFHFTGGPFFQLNKFNLILGLQYSFGRGDNLEQIINYSDPIEYNALTGESLQGTRNNNMRINYNEISVFFGITYRTGSNP
ncbi:MAG: hypothetical protein KAI99_14680 [Cyclobacteriaceae bacterium]|nr:hypothetical protein [Cyclobacteriaceae bacterium]